MRKECGCALCMRGVYGESPVVSLLRSVQQINDIVNDRIDHGGWPTRDRAAAEEDG